MPGVRLSAFLASTAVALVLSAATGSVFADPLPAPDGSAPAAANAPAGKAEKSTPAADQPAAVQPAASPSGTDNGTAADTSAPTPASSDSAIADQLHQLPSGKFDRIVGGKADRAAMDGFYSGRNYAPIWITDGQINSRAKTAIDYLAHVDADGLNPADYPIPDFKSTDPANLAEAELRLSMVVIEYAHHASIGRIHWSRVSGDIEFTTKAPEPAQVLAAMVESKDVSQTLDAYEPHAPNYLALKAKLAEIRAGKGDGTKPAIPSGPVLKIGSQDDRVPDLRDRLDVPGDGGTTYDKALSEAVKKYQQSHSLKVTGTLTQQTVDALNGHHPDHEVDTILANMERWRWMPHDLGKTYVIVNLPDFTLRVMSEGKQVWITRIVDGKPAMPTPIMTAEMKFITINPTWNVPPSIVNNEYLPALRQDPSVMERMGLKVDHNADGTVHIWQPPGERNALGRIRFNFPNKFLVYQHDTPDKYMFAFDKRAFSHGCMRVQDPAKYAEVLLSLVRPNDGYTQERIKKMFGTAETNIDLPTFIPVHLTYQTAFVDDDGKLQFREDMYGRDRVLIGLLNSTGEERRVAEIPVEHRIDITHRQVLAVPDAPSLWGGGGRNSQGGGTGEGFFSRLFGSFSQPQQQVRPAAQQRRRVTRARDTVER